MQMTIRNIPPDVRTRLAETAKANGKSLNQVAIDAMASGLGVRTERTAKRDLSYFTMTAEDAAVIEQTVAEMDAADLAAQRKEMRNADRARHEPVHRSRKRRS